MNGKQFVCYLLAAVACIALVSVFSQVGAAALEDQLPDTTGLFFGKRAAHPNMNNMLFGRRSGYVTRQMLLQRPPALNEELCKAIRIACAKLALSDEIIQQ